MKAFTVIYKHGQFYQKETDMLFSLQNDTEVIIVVENEDRVKLEVVKGVKLEPLNNIDKYIQVKAKSDKAEKILGSGDQLFFYVKIDENKKHLVTVNLLEDLYLFSKKSWKETEAKLFDCICEVEKIEGIKLKSKFRANSVSEIYKEVYVHFNLNKGNPARNAFNEFLLNPSDKKKNLAWVRKQTIL